MDCITKLGGTIVGRRYNRYESIRFLGVIEKTNLKIYDYWKIGITFVINRFERMKTIDALYQEWLSLQPIKEEDNRRLKQKFMLEFNYNSNHIEGNTLTYGQTEFLLLFGKAIGCAPMKDFEEMKASNVGLKMVQEQALSEYHLTENFIRQLHGKLLREDYRVYRELPGGGTTSYIVHAGCYKNRPNSVMTVTGERFEYASPEETPSLMTDLVDWYNEEEQKGELTVAQLCALFHYRYIRIHPFEDGNGRVARLLMNYILLRHNYPMIMVKSEDKSNYLDILSECDMRVGLIPSVGAHATVEQIEPFVTYIEMCMQQALEICIKAAKGESIEEDRDFEKELRILERQKRQQLEVKGNWFSAEQVVKILEYFYFPVVDELENVIKTVDEVFHFSVLKNENFLSASREMGGLSIRKIDVQEKGNLVVNATKIAQSVWFISIMKNPNHPKYKLLSIEKAEFNLQMQQNSD